MKPLNAEQLHSLVSHNRLSAAHEVLLARQGELPPAAVETLRTLNEERCQLVHWYEQGAPDPERTRLWAQLRERTHQAVDMAEGLLSSGEVLYWQALRKEGLSQQFGPSDPWPKVMSSPLLPEAAYNGRTWARWQSWLDDVASLCLTNLFDRRRAAELRAWIDAVALVADNATEARIDERGADDMELEARPEQDVERVDLREEADLALAYIAGALTHNLLGWHNTHVARLLLHLLTLGGLSRTQGRAAVALVAGIAAWPERWDEDKGLAAEFTMLCDARSDVTELLLSSWTAFAIGELTPEIETFVSEGIRGEIGHVARKLFESGKDGGTVSLDAGDMEELFGSESSFRATFDQMARWQLINADVCYAAMRMARRADFWHTPLHWFRPYSPLYASRRGPVDKLSAEALRHMAEAIDSNITLCDGDKYATLEAVGFTTQGGQQAALSKQLALEAGQMEPLRGEMAELLGLTSNEQLRPFEAAMSMVKDLYRVQHVGGAPLCNPHSDSLFLPSKTELQPALPRALRKALFESPDNVERVGHFLADNGIWQHAEQLYRAASEAEAMRAGKRQEGVGSIVSDVELADMREGGVDMSPTASMLRKLALCQLNMGQMPLALLTLKAANDCEPRHHWTLATLARVCQKMRRWPESLRYLEQAMSVGAATEADRLNRVYALLRCGRASEANRSLVEMLAENPEDAELIFLDAQTKLALGDAAGAKATYEYLRGLASDDEHAKLICAQELTRLFSVELLMSQGQWADARSRLKALRSELGHEVVDAALDEDVAWLRAAGVNDDELALCRALAEE